MDDSHDDSRRHSQDDSRWLTYDEIATLKRIKRSGAIRWVQRHRWRRQTGNDGQVRALVPGDWLRPRQSRDSQDDTPHDSRRDVAHDSRHDTYHDSVALSEANRRADEANRRADAAVALAERTLGQLADAGERADRADARATRLEVDLRAKDAELAEARRDLAAADSAASEARAALDAVRRQAADAQVAAEKVQLAQVEAQTMAEVLRGDLEAAHRLVQAAQERAQAVERAEAERVAERRGQGRWARLKAAWKGE